MSLTDQTDVSAPPQDFDVLDPRFYDDPWDGYRWLRDQAPVFWDERNDLWVVSCHEDVSHVSRHDELFSAAKGVRPLIDAPMSIIAMDDPEHTRQRRIVSKAFTPRKVRVLSERIRELSNQIIGEIAERGEVEFVSEFAIHVPLIIIAEMMGIDPEKRQDLYGWSDAMMHGDGHSDPEHPALVEAAIALGEYAEMCSELIAERRQNPADDLIGLLTGAFDAGELESDLEFAQLTAADGALSDEDLVMFLVLLVVAGNETTRNALSGGLAALSEFPEERDRLIEDPSLWDTAVDEIIRYVSPVMTFIRTVTETHDYKGHRFEEGQQVLMLYQSANRDEQVFDEPDRLIVDRSPNPHLAFGIGTHYCMGANLAKAEVRIVLEELLRRLPDIRRVEQGRFERGDSTLVVSIGRLQAIFTPESESA